MVARALAGYLQAYFVNLSCFGGPLARYLGGTAPDLEKIPDTWRKFRFMFHVVFVEAATPPRHERDSTGNATRLFVQGS